ncbi:MAG: hypothetical protein CBARDMAM_4208 [uncultured Caballeronia sp.]|nr:MAG: hypothetical protein CBARDMAM_4208 [uncultured Caballeronia sp.]
MLTEIISAPLAESGLGIAAKDLAETIVFAIKEFKEIARDGAHAANDWCAGRDRRCRD